MTPIKNFVNAKEDDKSWRILQKTLEQKVERLDREFQGKKLNFQQKTIQRFESIGVKTLKDLESVWETLNPVKTLDRKGHLQKRPMNLRLLNKFARTE